jgi:Fis family transcriptional regulator
MSTEKQSLQDCVRENVETYFADLDGTEPANVHDMLMRAVEKPLLEVVMARAQHNQSRAAQWLGLNRNTLRKKLLEHGLLG